MVIIPECVGRPFFRWRLHFFCVFLYLENDFRFMGKRLFYSFLFLSLLTSCGGGAAVEAPSGPEEEAMERVEAIYSRVCEEYNHVDIDDISSLEALTVTMLSFDRLYLSSEFLALRRRVREVDSLYYPNAFGFFDVDHWIGGQDWDSVSFRIDTAWSDGAGGVHVRLRLTVSGSTMTLELPMAKEEGEWKICDFVWFNPYEVSEMWSMKEYVEEEHEADPD